MAINPISCGISNINLQMVGKSGQPEQLCTGNLSAELGTLFAYFGERVGTEGPSPGSEGLRPYSGFQKPEAGRRVYPPELLPSSFKML